MFYTQPPTHPHTQHTHTHTQIYIYICGGVSIDLGVPLVITHLNGIFHYKSIHFGATPMAMETPRFQADGSFSGTLPVAGRRKKVFKLIGVIELIGLVYGKKLQENHHIYPYFMVKKTWFLIKIFP